MTYFVKNVLGDGQKYTSEIMLSIFDSWLEKNMPYKHGRNCNGVGGRRSRTSRKLVNERIKNVTVVKWYNSYKFGFTLSQNGSYSKFESGFFKIFSNLRWKFSKCSVFRMAYHYNWTSRETRHFVSIRCLFIRVLMRVIEILPDIA